MADPAVFALQKSLVELGCIAPENEGGELNTDGQMGPVVETGLRKLMEAAGDEETDFDILFRVDEMFKAGAARSYVHSAVMAGTKCEQGASADLPRP